ncbi:MAG: NAD(P)/FAD-dependent oxidoreductase [Methanotrichaceae archaeon]|nr:NAD(P)/FAD-dependent oxidoreductase [Methanotrichaceae archaeon]
MEKFDVAVVGAGPAGSMAARYAAKEGATVILLEEHPRVGWPVECAGLIGWRALEEAELPSNKFILRSLRGAIVYSPNGQRVSFKAKSSRAWVIDRRLFDRALLLEAVRAGAELRLASPVRAIQRNHDDYSNVLRVGEREKIRARVVISAEGVRARLARKAGLGTAKLVLSGAQIEVPFQLEDPENVEIYLGAAVGLFGWVIPVEKDSARIGLCTTEKGCDSLKAFLNNDIIRRRLLGSPVGFFVGGLPLGPPKSTIADGLMVVGDAAGQVKATSGGGIYPGLICAKIAGRIAAAASMEGDCSAERLQEYDKRWRALVGRELEIGMRLNQLLTKMSNADLDEVIEYLEKRPDLMNIIINHGDVDRPSELMMKMLPRIGLSGIKLIRLMRYALG